MSIEQEIYQSLADVIGETNELILLHRPYFPPTAWEYVKECLDTGWVSSAGAFVSKFETALAEKVGTARAVAVVNGTAALEVCFRLSGVQREDEVICPSLSFIATANAISHCGATPHFVDVTLERLSLCPEALKQRLSQVTKSGPNGPINRETGKRIGAVCLMHCFGHPGEIDAIAEVCSAYDIPLVEDAAESLGSFYKGKHTGRFGRMAAVSFNGNKILTTGGGGAILTDDGVLADNAKHLTTTAKIPHPWEFQHDEVGWNYRLPNINAALGYAQLEILDDLLAAKRRLALRYLERFQSVEGLNFLSEPADSRSNYWLNAIVTEKESSEQLQTILACLNQAGYQCRPIWEPLHQLRMYRACPAGPLMRTMSLKHRVVNIPSSADLALNWNQ